MSRPRRAGLENTGSPTGRWDPALPCCPLKAVLLPGRFGRDGFRNSPRQGKEHGLRDGSMDFVLSLIAILPFPGMFSAEVILKQL